MRRLGVILALGISLGLIQSPCLARPTTRAEFNTNLVSNPGFEAGSGSWQLQAGGSVAVSDTYAHAGDYSLKVTNNGGILSRYAYAFFPFRAGAVPGVSAWINTDNLDGAE